MFEEASSSQKIIWKDRCLHFPFYLQVPSSILNFFIRNHINLDLLHGGDKITPPPLLSKTL